MSGRKPRDMTGTAWCMDCEVRAVHERGPGSPLVIRHAPGCPEDRTDRRADSDAAVRAGLIGPDGEPKG